MKHTQIRISQETHDRLMVQRAKYIGLVCKFVSISKFIDALCQVPVEEIPDQEE